MQNVPPAFCGSGYLFEIQTCILIVGITVIATSIEARIDAARHRQRIGNTVARLSSAIKAREKYQELVVKVERALLAILSPRA